MKTKFRKIAALALSLVLICALAVSAFAVVYIEGNSDSVWCFDVKFHTEMLGNGTFVTTTMVEDAHGGNTYTGLITISYTICPEDQLRPNNYQSGSTSYSFTRYSTEKFKRYNPPSGYTMIEATGKTQITQTVNGAVYTTTTAPVTVTLD